MNEFERELQQTLRRLPAPDGFAERVMRHAALKERAQARMTRGWIAASLLAALLCGASIMVKQHREQREAAIAQQQFATAIRITGKTLSEVEGRIGRKHIRSSEVEQ